MLQYESAIRQALENAPVVAADSHTLDTSPVTTVNRFSTLAGMSDDAGPPPRYMGRPA